MKKDLQYLNTLYLVDKPLIQNKILYQEKTFINALANSTRPLTEKIFFNPEIGFIFSNFQWIALNEKLIPPIKN